VTKKLTNAEVPGVRNQLMATQGFRCALCNVSFQEKEVKNGKAVQKYRPCLDHCHKKGHVRAVLCNNCNGKEGKIMKLAIACQRAGTPLEWLVRLVAYLQKHETAQTPYIHPGFKTEREKKDAINKKARLKRAQAKAKKLLENK